MHIQNENIGTPLLLNMKNEIVIEFKPFRLGLEYAGHLVTGVHSQAAQKGVKVGWIIANVNHKAVPDNTSIIKKSIQQTYDKKKLTIISFIQHTDQFEGSQFEIHDKMEKKRGAKNMPKLLTLETLETEFRKWHRSREVKIETYGRAPYKPYFTYIIIFICVVVFIVELGYNGWKVEPFHNNPFLGPNKQTLRDMGAKDTLFIVKYGQWYRLFFSIFLHAGFLHLSFNMCVLYKVSRDLERTFGFRSTSLVFLISGTFSMITSAIFVPLDLNVGASGAIFGMIGASWADFIQNYTAIKKKCSFFSILLIQTIICLGFGVLPWLDNFCHIGGIICGLICGLVVYLQRRYVNEQRQTFKKYQVFNRIFGICALVIMFITSLLVLYLGVDPEGWCHWCHYLTCIETTWWPCAKARETCSFQNFANNTHKIYCPDGSEHLSNAKYDIINCQTLCF